MNAFKKYLAEFIGTFVLVFFACGTACVVGCDSAAGTGYLLTALAFGLVIVAMAYSIGNVSGCHINPAVSIAMLVLKKLSPRRKASLLAVAEQENELILPFTVRECIKLGCYIRNDGDDELVTRLLTQWQMLHWQDKMFAELSGGERQRVKLLRVLAQDTPYILLDEPASSLDWARQLDLYEKMRTLAHESGKCVIMICHDLYMAPAFIDEMLLMKSGSLIYSGKPDSAEANAAISEAFERDITVQRCTNSVTVSW